MDLILTMSVTKKTIQLLSVKFLQGASKKFDFNEFFSVEECSLNSEEIPLYYFQLCCSFD